LNQNGLRRSERLKQKEPINDNGDLVYNLFVNFAKPESKIKTKKISFQERILYVQEYVNLLIDDSLNFVHEIVLSIIDNEVYHLKGMLKQEDKSEFIKAMVNEIEVHQRRHHWELCPRSEVPKDMKTIQSVWSFKRKRLPDGTLLKHKARLCAHGGQQQWGVNYWETYAPVVNWASVRLLLALSHIHGLESRSIDFVLAFPQADLETVVYMEIPYGFDRQYNNEKYVLRLLRSIYGLKQSNYNFYKKLSTALKARGILPCSTDNCVYASKNLILIVYVDDVLIFSKKNVWIDIFLKSLFDGDEKFELTDEGDIDKYLGVDVNKVDDGVFELRQPFLIKRIIDELNLSLVDSQKRPTPVAKPLLHKDLQGKPRVKKWKYRSIIGILTYLQGISRPDISMAVHQCARFSNDPKLSHERAVTRIY